MSNYYEKGSLAAGSAVDHDSLIYDTAIPQKIKAVTLKSGQGVLKRGTVLGIITDSNLAVPVDSSKTDGSENPDCILTDNTDTAGSVGVVQTGYESGVFNGKALIFGGSDTVANHETEMRRLGMFLADKI